MKWILIFLIFNFIAIGFFVMDKLDKFIVSPYSFPDTQEEQDDISSSDIVLVFGKHMISDDIVKLLEARSISFKKIADFNEFDKSNSFKYLFAVDSSDLENLMICSISQKMMGITKRIAICNSLDNAKVYKDKRIPYLYGESISAVDIVNSLFSPLS